ncbi:MAG: hypothetical protein K2N56_05375 [Oscillospiraceae bacterium]|nr:hypothetical protein [Oscillospiraceae bacterium]
MTLKGFNEDNGWISVDYAGTWRYGYDFMLDAAQVLLGDFGDDLQRFAKAEIAGGEFINITDKIGKKVRDCEELSKECGVIAVAGISKVMQCPLQVIFYNQTNAVGLDVPVSQMPEDHPARKIFDERKPGYEHTFDCYMDSVEIKAYCADTERRTVERLKKGE